MKCAGAGKLVIVNNNIPIRAIQDASITKVVIVGSGITKEIAEALSSVSHLTSLRIVVDKCSDTFQDLIVECVKKNAHLTRISMTYISVKLAEAILLTSTSAKKVYLNTKVGVINKENVRRFVMDNEIPKFSCSDRNGRYVDIGLMFAAESYASIHHKRLPEKIGMQYARLPKPDVTVNTIN